MAKEDDFLSAYDKIAKKPDKIGIPGRNMNRVFVNENIIAPAGKIGLELEMEATNRLPTGGHLDHIRAPNTGAQWSPVRDGSLRGNSIEYILSTPANEEEIPYLLNELFEALKKYSTVLDNSNRCSTHVHLNASKLKINQITSFVILWGLLEPALIRWCGEERQTNHFCLSFKDTNDVVDNWHGVLLGKGGFGRGAYKYSALNLEPLFTRGSIEIRCGRAADEPSYPILWATLLSRLLDFAINKYENPASVSYELSERGGYEILKSVCDTLPKDGDKLFDEIILGHTRDSFNAECLDGFRRVQKLSLGHPWEDWLPEINKVYVPNPFGGKQKAARPFEDEGEFEAMIEPDQPAELVRPINPRWNRGQFQQVVDAEQAELMARRQQQVREALRAIEDRNIDNVQNILNGVRLDRVN